MIGNRTNAGHPAGAQLTGTALPEHPEKFCLARGLGAAGRIKNQECVEPHEEEEQKETIIARNVLSIQGKHTRLIGAAPKVKDGIHFIEQGFSTSFGIGEDVPGSMVHRSVAGKRIRQEAGDPVFLEVFEEIGPEALKILFLSGAQCKNTRRFRRCRERPIRIGWRL